MSTQILHTLRNAPAALGFGQYFAPQMLVADYHDGAWGPSRLVEMQNLAMHPAAKVLHYAQEIFEGLKVYRGAHGVTLFRPRDNIRRMTRSAEIMSMAPYPEDQFLRDILQLSTACRDLVPSEPGSLYLRPTMIGSTPTLGVAAATDYQFYILASPSGGYFGDLQPGVPAAISVWVSDKHVRAVRGGLGEAKTGANYAASLAGVNESKKRGYNNVLFLDAIERKFVEELSGMNVFVVQNGTLRTPPCGDTILRGVTRDSVLQIARAQELRAEESPIDIQDLVRGVRDGSVSEMFACGTGASITAITELGWHDDRLKVGQGIGPVTTQLYRAMTDILYGRKAPPVAEWLERC